MDEIKIDLTPEESVKNALTERFAELDGKVGIRRQRRIDTAVPFGIVTEVIAYAKNELGFEHICTITGLDIDEEFQIIYHISNERGIVLNLKTNIPKRDPVIKTVTDVFNGAVFYEREIESMFGVKVEGLPQGRRYPVPDGWPEDQHPLRKDWKPEMLNNCAQDKVVQDGTEGGRG